VAIYSDEMFNTQGESTSLAQLNEGSGTTTGKYTPAVRGKLVRVVLLIAGEAATSLWEFVRVELDATIWTPNKIKIGLAGGGIRTAPAFPTPPAEWPLDLDVETDQPINGQYIHATNATPITCNLRVFGIFRTGA